MSNKRILSFIANFDKAQDTFLNGCCYWFAFILQARFSGKIYYDQVQNHFAAKICGRYYDVTGEISGDGFVPWDTYQSYDALDYSRVVRYCIDKL